MAVSFAAAAAASSSAQPTSSTTTPTPSTSNIQHLILDAGPLLSLTPLRDLAGALHTTPQVLAELRDPRAREHWERMKLQGVDIRVEQPSADAMAKVTAFARKTGDYAVLSSTDMGVVALTYQYEVAVNGDERIRTDPGQKLPPRTGRKVEEEQEQDKEEGEEEVSAADYAVETEEVVKGVEGLKVEDGSSEEKEEEAAPAPAETEASTSTAASTSAAAAAAWGDDDDGEWITPANVKQHRSRDLGHLPDEGKAAAAPLAAACMTGDYAVQNVLLGMGLGLVGEGGKRISKVRSWVLRCHACFKLCKDNGKRFCPSCGNASLMRTTVTTSASTGKQTIHLKKNFQYHLRGTKYDIPAPKPGAAKGQKKSGSGLILREDQMEWQDAVRVKERERAKESKRAAKGDGSWMDPDVSFECSCADSSGCLRLSPSG